MFKNKGFSLLELLLVVAITAGIFAFSAPFGMNFYRTQLLGDVQSNLIDALQRARHNAVLQKNDSNFGVHIVAGSYTIFQTADTYANRASTTDEVFPVINNITFSGPTDIIFSKLTGIPNATGTVAMAYDILTKRITIDSSGGISKNDSVVLAGGGTSGCVATGGATSTAGGYMIHTFTDVGEDTFEVTSGSCNVEVLVVAGGGGGGKGEGNNLADGGGGGGSGGLVYNSSYTVNGSADVVVGNGGGGSTSKLSKGSNGSSSVFGTITAIGGGGGGSDNDSAINIGADGGSGGGAASRYNTSVVGGDADYIIPRQGYDGGNIAAAGLYDRGGAGGGGSSGVGGSRSTGMPGGLGGVGTINSISGSSVTYASGGKGGDGGSSSSGSSGVANTGNGGGGAGGDGGNGGTGGSGIVIVRYPTN